MDFSSNLLEQMRLHHQKVELLQEAICQALAYKSKFPKERVVCEILIRKIADDIALSS